MAHSRSLVLFLLFLPGVARRSIRTDNSYHGAHQRNNMLVNGLEVSAEAREVFNPGAPGTGVFRRAGQQAGALGEGSQEAGRRVGHLEFHRAAPSFRFGPRHAKVDLKDADGPEADQSPSKKAPRGFGPPKKAAPAKAKAVKKRVGKATVVRRDKAADKAAEDFEKLKAGGAPEYMVLIRTVDAGGTPSKWYPVGGIAVPRSSSEDQSLALAIFNNEDDLLRGAFRSYPFLSKTDDKFEYGYRLKAFEDDPVKVATKENMEKANNPIQQWFNSLDNPLNDGSGWFNPLKK